MMTEYEKELVKEIKHEIEAIQNDASTDKAQKLDRIKLICNIMLDVKPSEINPETPGLL